MAPEPSVSWEEHGGEAISILSGGDYFAVLAMTYRAVPSDGFAFASSTRDEDRLNRRTPGPAVPCAGRGFGYSEDI